MSNVPDTVHELVHLGHKVAECFLGYHLVSCSVSPGDHLLDPRRAGFDPVAGLARQLGLYDQIELETQAAKGKRVVLNREVAEAIVAMHQRCTQLGEHST